MTTATYNQFNSRLKQTKTPDTLEQLRFALELAQDHLNQYRRYSEEMRKIGRGLYLSSPYSADYADGIIATALADTTSLRLPEHERE